MKKSDGFTLVELLVGILCAAIVTGAAMTLMLMGARSNRALLDANSEQNTARIITTMVESLASEGDIHKIEFLRPENTSSVIGWNLLDSFGDTILSYSKVSNSICTRDGSVLMEGVTDSSLSITKNQLAGSLLDLSIETKDNLYKTSVYSRSTTITPDMTLDSSDVSADITESGSSSLGSETETINPGLNESDGRYKFLEVLCSQYGSTGKIQNHTSSETPFSLWYITKKYLRTSYDDYNKWTNLPDIYKWNENTPWCACFISWGLSEIGSYLNYTPSFAHVEDGYSNFQNRNFGTLKEPSTYRPIAGDLIFFDWASISNASAAPSTLDHIGVVFYCDENYVYTIEGNTSIDANGVGRVDLKRYYLNDTDIKGYGILNWT